MLYSALFGCLSAPRGLRESKEAHYRPDRDIRAESTESIVQ